MPKNSKSRKIYWSKIKRPNEMLGRKLKGRFQTEWHNLTKNRIKDKEQYYLWSNTTKLGRPEPTLFTILTLFDLFSDFLFLAKRQAECLIVFGQTLDSAFLLFGQFSSTFFAFGLLTFGLLLQNHDVSCHSAFFTFGPML